MGLIRFFLALSVALHYWQFSAPFALPIFGRTAVQCFFVISGFYMQLMLASVQGSMPAVAWQFYASRFLRIFPLYWLFLVLTLIVEPYTNNNVFLNPQIDGSMWQVGTLATKAIVIVSNATIVGLDALRFTLYDPTTGALHWTGHWSADIRFWGSGLATMGSSLEPGDGIGLLPARAVISATFGTAGRRNVLCLSYHSRVDRYAGTCRGQLVRCIFPK